MLAVSFRLLAGHYHATPWGRHVNEGEVEWPPSPWRLLRALLATWHAKARDEISETVMRRLVGHLGEVLPEYFLPAVTLGHSRHYMPLYNSARDGKTARVFDAFAATDGALVAAWPGVCLDADEAGALARLLGVLGYLGRAESWVEGTIVDAVPDDGLVCRPLQGALPGDCEAIRLLAPMHAQAFSEWRERIRPNGNGRAKSTVHVPSDVWEALHVDTGALRAKGWSDPPGACWALYGRPREACDVRPEPVRRGRAPQVLPQVARYAVASTVSPGFLRGVTFAERLHDALVDLSSRDGVPLPVFTGQDADRQKREGHRHTHILLEANDPRHAFITHVTLYAPEGFPHEARRTIEQLRLIYRAGGHHAQLVLLGVGSAGDFAGTRVLAGQCPLFATSRVWVSRTPFVPTRHPKRYRSGAPKLDAAGRQIDGPEHELLRLLAPRFPDPPVVTPLAGTDLAGRPIPWRNFRTIRYEGTGLRAASPACGFRLEFPEPVQGPIAIGYGAHFGLGLFVPEGTD